MKRDTMKAAADVAEGRLFDNWFDPMETVRSRSAGLYRNSGSGAGGRAGGTGMGRGWSCLRPTRMRRCGHRHGHRSSADRHIRPGDAVPRARIIGTARRPNGGTRPLGPISGAPGRCSDRLDLSLRDQHAPRAPGARGFVRRRRRQGHG